MDKLIKVVEQKDKVPREVEKLEALAHWFYWYWERRN